MDNNELLIKELVRDEGVVLHAYQDSVGLWTIGIGRLIDKRKGGGITQAEAEYLLANDVDKVVSQLDAKLPWWRQLSPVRMRVIINMAFNLGVDGLLGFKNTLGMVQRGEFEAASKGMLNSTWAKQVGNRAVRLADMMKAG